MEPEKSLKIGFIFGVIYVFCLFAASLLIASLLFNLVKFDPLFLYISYFCFTAMLLLNCSPRALAKPKNLQNNTSCKLMTIGTISIISIFVLFYFYFMVPIALKETARLNYLIEVLFRGNTFGIGILVFGFIVQGLVSYHYLRGTVNRKTPNDEGLILGNVFYPANTPYKEYLYYKYSKKYLKRNMDSGDDEYMIEIDNLEYQADNPILQKNMKCIINIVAYFSVKFGSEQVYYQQLIAEIWFVINAQITSILENNVLFKAYEMIAEPHDSFMILSYKVTWLKSDITVKNI